MTSRLVALALDARDPARLAGFWGDLLRRTTLDEPRGPRLPGSDTQVGLRFVRSPSVRVGSDRAHLHLTSTSAEDQQATIAAALDLAAHHLDVGQQPDEGHVVLGDPEDNAFCVIEPTSSFLAGCGVLGEVACDGTRRVGRFWAAALEWPLVWDQDEETAIQSPHGGTKIAWGGPPLAPKPGRNRQHLELATDDLEAEASRLVALGATRLGALGDDVLELADPDGNELVLTLEPAARSGRNA